MNEFINTQHYGEQIVISKAMWERIGKEIEELQEENIKLKKDADDGKRIIDDLMGIIFAGGKK